MKSKKHIFIFLFFVVIAASLRFISITDRPMHGDETINAFKLAELLEEGLFTYDPNEFHGPTLYYFSLPFCFLAGALSLPNLDEYILRQITVIFGLLLFFYLFLSRSFLSDTAILFSSFFLTFSPLFIFYSRYFIHEMLFVLITYGVVFAGYFYLKSPGPVKAIILGSLTALLIATKETWIIVFFSFVLAVSTLILFKKNRVIIYGYLKNTQKKDYLVGILSFGFVFILLFSSFFKNVQGVPDAFLSIGFYAKEISESSAHHYPWYQYLLWLLNPANPFLMGEGLILIMALYGYFILLRKPDQKIFVHFLALFSIFTFLVYSIIPYKTPWNILTSWFGVIVIAGYGLSHIISALKKNNSQKVLFILFFLMGIQYVSYSVHLNFYEGVSERNPYMYAQPTTDVYQIQQKIIELAEKGYNKFDQSIEVNASNNDYWPLPWYLRKFSNIAWRNKIDFAANSASIIFISPDLEDQLAKKLYQIPAPGKRNLYIPLFKKEMFLRQDVSIKAYIKKSVLDSLNK